MQDRKYINEMKAKKQGRRNMENEEKIKGADSAERQEAKEKVKALLK